MIQGKGRLGGRRHTEKKHKKTGRFIFFLVSIVFLDKSKINYMYMYFRPARSRSLFILASTLGDIRGREKGEVSGRK